MERCRNLFAQFSKDIRTYFGLDKRAVLHVVKGKIIDSPIVQDIPLLSSKNSYKYLGLIQREGIIHDKIKDNINIFLQD